MPISVPEDELRAWLRLSMEPELSITVARQLLSVFGLPPSIYDTAAASLARVVPAAMATQMRSEPSEKVQKAIDAALAWAEEPGHYILTLADDIYPKALFDTHDPPLVLYVNGDPALLSRPAIAVVGARSATPGGLDNARAFARHLAAQGWCVISGLALGVDAAAHEGALQAGQDGNRNAGVAAGKRNERRGRSASSNDNEPHVGNAGAKVSEPGVGDAVMSDDRQSDRQGGGTIAVLGTGIDIVYPAVNRDLAHRIAAGGALVSEFPMGTKAFPYHFPRRNRIVAGLARGVLVVEAAQRSGSLITARLASEAGREVFAIPGSIHSPLSRGCHALIRQGARLVESGQDILEELGSPNSGLIGTAHRRMMPPPSPPSPSGDPAPSPSAPSGDLAATAALHCVNPASSAQLSFGDTETNPSPPSDAPTDQPAPLPPATNCSPAPSDAIPPDTADALPDGISPDSPAAKILASLGYDPVDADRLAVRTALDISTLNATLLDLELSGHLIRLPGDRFQRPGT